MRRYFDLLRRRPQYRSLWLAYAVSLFGDWFNTIATLTIVNRFTDSGLAVSLLLVARFLPPFVMGPIAGVIADRFDRKRILYLSNFLRVGIVLGMLLVTRQELVWLIYALSLAQFIVSSFFEPAQAAILPYLVNREEVVHANTLINATWSAMLAIGAAAGGLFAALFGTSLALVIDALTFLLAGALILGGIRINTRPETEAEINLGSGIQDFVDGLRYLRQHPRTAMIATVKAIQQVGSVDIMAAVYAERIFVLGEGGAGSLGLLLGATGVGAVLGPLIGDALGVERVRSLQRAIAVGFLLMPIGWIAFGWAPTLPLAMVALLLRGAGGSINWTYSSALEQIKIPGRYLGRVFSIDFGIFTLVLSLSTFLTGWILDAFALDPRTLAIILGVGSIIPMLAWWAFVVYDERNPEAPKEALNAASDRR